MVYRLLGSSADSSSVVRLIQSIDMQIAMQYRRQPQVPTNTTFEEAAKWFAEGNAFDCATHTSPLVVILDGLDELHDSNRALDDIGQWCPGVRNPLPPHVKLVITSLSQIKGKSLQSKINFRGRHGKDTQAKLDLFIEIDSFPMTDEISVQNQFKRILNCRPASGEIVSVKHVLSQPHLAYISKILVEHPSAFSAMLLLDIAAKWPSYYNDEVEVLSMTVAQHGSDGLVHLLLQELEDQHGRLLVEAVLCVLTLSADGLSLSEMEDLVSTIDDVLDDVFEWWTPPIRRIPPMLVHRLLRDFKRYIGEQGSRGGVAGVYRWYHQQFAAVTKNRYLTDKGKQQYYYSILGKYFCNLLEPDMVKERRLTPQTLVKHGNDINIWSKSCRVNVRRVSEGACGLIAAGLLEEAMVHLCSIPQVCAYLKSNSATVLLEELFLIRDKYELIGHSTVPLRLHHYIRWLQQDMTAVIINPELNIFSTVAIQPGISLARSDAVALLSSTDSNTVTGFERDSWIRCKQLGSRKVEFDNTKIVLAGHDYKVPMSTWSTDGRHLASTSWGNCIRVWSVSTGEKLSYFTDCSVRQADWMKWSNSSQYIASYPAMQGNEILVWEPLSNNVVAGFSDSHLLYWSPFSSDLCTIKSDLKTCTVTNSDAWSEVCTYNAEQEENILHAMWVSESLLMLASVGQVMLWNTAINKIEFTVPGVLKSCSAHGDFIVMYIGDSLRLLKTRTMEIINEFMPNNYDMNVKCSLNASGDKMVINQMNSAVWFCNENSNEWEITYHLATYHHDIWCSEDENDSSDDDLFNSDSDASNDNSRSPNPFGSTRIFIRNRNTKVMCYKEHNKWNNQGNCIVFLRTEAPTDPTVRYCNSVLFMVNPVLCVEYQTELGPVQSWSLSPHDDRVAAAADFIDKYVIKIMDIKEKKKEVRACSDAVDDVSQQEEYATRALCWIPHSKVIATASNCHSVSLFSATTNENVTNLKFHNDNITCISVSPCGSFIAAGSDDHKVSVWQSNNNTDWQLCAQLTEHSDCVKGVGFGVITDADGRTTHLRLVTASSDGLVMMHAVKCDTCTGSIVVTCVTELVVTCSISEHQAEAAEDSCSGDVRLGNSARVSSLACNPVNCCHVLIGYMSGRATVWNVSTKSIVTDVCSDDDIESWRRQCQPCVPVAWHPCGAVCAVAGAEINCLHVYDTQHGHSVKEYTLDDRSKRNMMSSDYIFQIAWSHCGRRIASCSAHSYIRVWDCDTRSMLTLLEGHKGNVFGVCWSAVSECESMLASSGEDGVLRVWDSVNVTV